MRRVRLYQFKNGKQPKHDALVPADEPFTLCVTRIARAQRDLTKWRKNLRRYFLVVTHGGRDGL